MARAFNRGRSRTSSACIATARSLTAQNSGKSQEVGDAAASIPRNAKPLSVEVGKASWYGAPYHNRRSSNGEIYDMHSLTAAHRTLPLGSTVRVTNLKTGHSTVVRITDRGPFIEGRIVDLSLAAAKQADIWQAGVAQVRLEVLRRRCLPPIATGGGRCKSARSKRKAERIDRRPSNPAIQDSQGLALQQPRWRLVGPCPRPERRS